MFVLGGEGAKAAPLLAHVAVIPTESTRIGDSAASPAAIENLNISKPAIKRQNTETNSFTSMLFRI